MRYLIAGTCRNITPTWERVKQSLFRIFDTVKEYTCVIVESNSNDNTLQLLNSWNAPNVKILSLGNLNGSRTQRIARCRNEYLKYIDGHDMMLVVDLDDVLVIQPNFEEQLNSCFVRSDWDAIGSNRTGIYYDLWALRSKQLGFDFDCWDMLARNDKKWIGKIKNSYQHFVGQYFKVLIADGSWIECQSAFCGMALYKIPSIRRRVYDGNTTCEHVSFNSGLRMFINTKFMSG